MKKYIYLLLATLFVPYLLTSCASNDDDDTELTENCIITGFTLGQLKRSMYMKTTAGMDSIYSTSFSGSVFPMTINQHTLTIENQDSLPTRTRLDKVLTTVTFDGVLLWRKAQLSEEDDTAWTTYSNKDSLDLSQPLHFRVYSATGLSSRTYTVKLNVHQQDGDSTTWHNLGSVEALSQVQNRKLMLWGDSMYILGRKTDGTMLCLRRSEQLTDDWAPQPVTGAEKAVPGTLQMMNSSLYMSTTDGRILTSTDALNWTEDPLPAMDGLTLVGASDDYLYALCDRKLYRGAGTTWTEERLDDSSENLPTEELNSVLFTLPSEARCLMLVGSRKTTDTTATIWTKSWAQDEETQEGWMYYTLNEANKYPCPMLKGLCIEYYDGGLQALGGRSRDGRYAAMDSIFHSNDYGIAWKTYDGNDMPVDSELRAQAQSATYFSTTVDRDNYLWVLVDQNVWRGRINRLGFLRDDK